jgi:L-iditol 2-dehydrogenase
MAVQLAKLAGAEVLLVTRQAAKRRLGEDLGASLTAATLPGALALWPQGADLVLECAGVPETVTGAPALCTPGGRVVILGVLPKGTTVPIDPFDLLFREISLLYSFLNPFTQGRAAHLIASGMIQVAPLISRQIPLDDAVQAISQPPHPDDVKVLIVP